MLKGKIIILGVTGGIAAYKSCSIVSQLVKKEADVWVVMTRSAINFISPLTFRTLSGNPCLTEMFDPQAASQPVPHIALADKADLILVAPATANIIGKVANGIADDLLSTTIMAAKAPVIFAPAMNSNMWDNPIVQENIKELKKLKYHFIDPAYGRLACGWEGEGRLAEIPTIIKVVEKTLGKQS